MHPIRSLALVAALALAAPSVNAQTYPSKPVRIIVPSTPGGSLDTLSRMVGQRLSDAIGQSVVVENRAGSGGVIGTDYVAKSSPDGYTLLTTYISHPVNATLYPKLPYDTLRDFSPIAMLAAQPLMMAVPPSLGVANVEELIKLARAKPGALNFSSAGSGTAGHLAAELFNSMAGIKVVHVPHKGVAGALTDLIGERVQISFASLITMLPHVRSGKLRALGVTSARRSSIAPEVPTISEAGLPGYDMTATYYMLGPAGIPADVVQKLNTSIGRVVVSNAVKERLAADGAEPVGGTPAELGAFIEAEVVKWGKVVKASGAKAD